MSQNKSAKARHSFCNGCSCAQSILTTYSAKYDIDVQQAMKLTTGLAGGMGKMANTCGTVTGAILVLGLDKSSGNPDDYESKEATMQAVRDFSKEFEEKHGSLVCRELLECDISEEKGYQQAREQELFTKRCPNFVETSIEILEKLIEK